MVNMRMFAVFFIGIIIAISISYFTVMGKKHLNQYLETNTITTQRITTIYGPAPFDKIAEEVSLDVVIKQWSKRGWILYLPTYLPKNLRLTAVYAKVLNGEVGNIIVLVYSNTNDKGIYSAEFTMEVEPLPEIPWHVSNSSRQKMIKVNGLDMFLDTRAPYFDPYGEYYKKYGVEYCIIADVKIDKLVYGYCFAPIIDVDEIVKILESMKPVTS